MHPKKQPSPLVRAKAKTKAQANAKVKVKVKAKVMTLECIVWRHLCTKLSQVRFQEYIGSLHLLVRLAQSTTALIDSFAQLPSPHMTTASIHFLG